MSTEAFEHTIKDLSNDSSFEIYFSLKSSLYFVDNIAFRTTLPTSKNRQHNAMGRVQQKGYFHKNQNKQIIPPTHQ